jgi:hypothetical protein
MYIYFASVNFVDFSILKNPTTAETPFLWQSEMVEVLVVMMNIECKFDSGISDVLCVFIYST